MKTRWTLALPLALALNLTPTASTPALAGPAYADMTPAQKAVYDAVNIELKTVEDMLTAFKTVAEAKGGNLGDDAKKAWQDGKALHAEAKALHDAGQYKDAYKKARDAYEAVKPAAAAVLAKDNVPKAVVDACAARIQATAEEINALADQVKGHADANGHYKAAKDLHADAKALWKDGKREDGFLKNHDATKEFDAAIYAVWPEAW